MACFASWERFVAVAPARMPCDDRARRAFCCRRPASLTSMGPCPGCARERRGRPIGVACDDVGDTPELSESHPLRDPLAGDHVPGGDVRTGRRGRREPVDDGCRRHLRGQRQAHLEQGTARCPVARPRPQHERPWHRTHRLQRRARPHRQHARAQGLGRRRPGDTHQDGADRQGAARHTLPDGDQVTITISYRSNFRPGTTGRDFLFSKQNHIMSSMRWIHGSAVRFASRSRVTATRS